MSACLEPAGQGCGRIFKVYHSLLKNAVLLNSYLPGVPYSFSVTVVSGSLQWHEGMVYCIWTNGSVSIITNNDTMVEFFKAPFEIKTVISYYT